jgi:lipopolysaccharide export system permease protein
MFYKFLKKDREFNNPGWPFLIKVRDVDLDTRVMDTAIFKHRKKGEANPNSFGAIVTAQKARINFDLKAGVARVYLEKAEISNNTVNDDIELFNKTYFDFPMSDKLSTGDEKKVQQWTTAEMVAEQANLRVLISRERQRQAIEAALWMASGRIERVDWRQVQSAFIDHGYWSRRLCEFETEKQLRVAQSFGSLIFVLLGAPVGIRFARRDYLSAFISCFMPIIVMYYPLMLLGSNLGRENVIDPTYALWAGNLVLVVLAFSVLRPIHKH